MNQFKDEEIKPLTINGVLYAKYAIENIRGLDLLFLKVFIDIIPNKKGESEDYLISLIQLIEKKQVTGAAYLNIES